MKNSKKIIDISILVVAISIAFYVGLIIFSDFEKISSSFEQVELNNYPLIIFLSFIIYFILAVRFHYLLQSIGTKISFRDSLLISFSGQAMFSTIGRAGAIVKSYLIKRKYGDSISSTGPVVIFEQFLDLKSSVIVLIISLFLFQILESQIITIIGIVSVILLFLIMKNNKLFFYLKKIFSRIRFLKKFVENIDESKESLDKLLNIKILIISTGLSLLTKILQIFVVFLIFDSLQLNLGFVETGLVYYTSMLAGSFSLLPGGIIVTDSSMIGLLLKNNIELATSSAAVIITRFITLWFAVIIGLVSLKITLKILK